MSHETAAAKLLPGAVRIPKAAERPDIQNPTSEDLHSKQKEREVQGLACAR